MPSAGAPGRSIAALSGGHVESRVLHRTHWRRRAHAEVPSIRVDTLLDRRLLLQEGEGDAAGRLQ